MTLGREWGLRSVLLRKRNLVAAKGRDIYSTSAGRKPRELCFVSTHVAFSFNIRAPEKSDPTFHHLLHVMCKSTEGTTLAVTANLQVSAGTFHFLTFPLQKELQSDLPPL
jgi:hypothetical protein